MKVGDVYRKITKKVEKVHPEDKVEEVIKKVSRSKVSRAVYVVNESDELVGIIRMREILKILGMRYVQEDALTMLSDILAKTAKDIMIEPVSVSVDDNAEEALKIAVRYELEDVPVTKRGKVIGDLNCFEILLNIKQ